MNQRVLVVAAHPDDEVLGCGATIARHIAQGDTVQTLLMSNGITSRDKNYGKSSSSAALALLAKSAERANAALGVTDFQILQFPDNCLDSVDLLDVIQSVENVIEKFQPTVIYTHHCGDLNIDHQITHQAVVTAARPLPNSRVESILFFEVCSSTDFQISGSAPPFTPNWYVDVTGFLTKKINALKEYSSEMRPWPHARSYETVQHLASWRGSNIGVEAAEAFMTGRHMRKL